MAAAGLCSSAPSPAMAKAAQQTAVALMLLRLRTLSPQPPSGLALAASQPRPCSMRPWCRSRPVSASAETAVAVDSALLHSSPSQWPLGSRHASS